MVRRRLLTLAGTVAAAALLALATATPASAVSRVDCEIGGGVVVDIGDGFQLCMGGTYSGEYVN